VVCACACPDGVPPERVFFGSSSGCPDETGLAGLPHRSLQGAPLRAAGSVLDIWRGAFPSPTYFLATPLVTRI
jgi:hypothetical protein